MGAFPDGRCCVPDSLSRDALYSSCSRSNVDGHVTAQALQRCLFTELASALAPVKGGKQESTSCPKDSGASEMGIICMCTLELCSLPQAMEPVRFPKGSTEILHSSIHFQKPRIHYPQGRA